MFSNLSIAANAAKIDYPIADSNLPFAEYIAICRQIIENGRNDLNQSPDTVKKIIDANSPYSLTPSELPANGRLYKQGALLIHGLYDCPFTMRDISEQLQKNGIFCRSILLPGHGTQAVDLLHTSYHDWIQAVRYGVESLRKEVENIFLIGYSTGAALATYHAFQDKHIAGIILIAPAIKVHRSVSLGLTWHKIKNALIKDKEWLHVEKEIDYVKYRSMTFNSVKQVIYLTEVINELAQQHDLMTPTLMILSHEDETISPTKAIDFFSNLANQDNRLMLYTAKDTSYIDPRIQVRHVGNLDNDIKSFSHACLPFTPNNPHYGKQGDFLRASTTDENKYLHGAYNGAIERGYHLLYKLGILNKQRRKLTYNPDFQYFADEMVGWIGRFSP